MAFVDLCRLCGTDTLNIVRNAIFEGEGRVKKYALKISECLTLKVAEEDQLPKIMCGECSYKLDLLSDFRDEAYKTETQLLSKINVNKVKAELPDVIDSPDLDNDDLGGDDNSGSSSPEPLPEPLVEIKEEENLPKKRSPTKRSWRVLESEGEETPVKKRGRLPKQPATTPKATAATPVAAPPKENSGPLVELVDNCEVCCKPLQSAAELRLHLRTCINPKHRLQRENALKCPTCKSQFKDANALAVHMKVHNPPPPPAIGKRNESPKSSAKKSASPAKKLVEKKFSCDVTLRADLLTYFKSPKLSSDDEEEMADNPEPSNNEPNTTPEVVVRKRSPAEKGFAEKPDSQLKEVPDNILNNPKLHYSYARGNVKFSKVLVKRVKRLSATPREATRKALDMFFKPEAQKLCTLQGTNKSIKNPLLKDRVKLYEHGVTAVQELIHDIQKDVVKKNIQKANFAEALTKQAEEEGSAVPALPSTTKRGRGKPRKFSGPSVDGRKSTVKFVEDWQTDQCTNESIRRYIIEKLTYAKTMAKKNANVVSRKA